jgi:hypothetical protein
MATKHRNLISVSKAIEAFRLLGPFLFFQNLGRQLSSVTPYFVLVHELDGLLRSDEKVSLELASSEDVASFFGLMAKESRRSRYELLVRREFYEKGFHDCYIGRMTNTREMCSIGWFVTSRDIQKTGSENYYPQLKADEVLGENIYILEKFRGKGVASSSARQHRAIARKLGYDRMLFYIREDNIPSLSLSMNVGDRICQRIVRHKRLFRVNMKIIDQFDPPIPISIPDRRIM